MIYFCGDVHGNFDHAIEVALRDRPTAIIFLGDLEARKPFEEIVRPLDEAGIEVWFIHGNHDTDRAEYWSNIESSRHRNLHGRVQTVAGLAVAGLGGVFREEIWHPRLNGGQPVYRSYEELSQAMPAEILRKHRSTIFHDDYFRLYGQPADMLVTHEAPSCHPHGFSEIDALAQSMHVKALFNGHHHDRKNYIANHLELGFQPHLVGFCGITDMHGGIVVPERNG